MHKAILFLATLLLVKVVVGKLFYIEVKYPLLGNVAPPGSVWPMPDYMGESSNTLYYLLKNSFEIRSNSQCDIIQENIKFYHDILFPPNIIDYSYVESKKELKALEIVIENDISCVHLYPNSNMDESYELKVHNGAASVKAKSVWGALRGLETFSQLTFITPRRYLAVNDSTHIVDKPRFSYRGLLLDTARHYLPVNLLKKQIDAMSYSKFNVLHWHIVDDQSFPLESKVYPDLTKNGRYTPAHVYSQHDVREVIEHARLRGIRVIPEFDTPGHVESFGRTFPQFITVCWNDGKPYQAIYTVQGKAEILNPTLDALYPVLHNIIKEFKSLFPDEYIHLGNDEVYYECWKSNPSIAEWMKKHNFTEYHQLEAYYSTKLLKIAKGLKKKATIWQDVYDNGVVLDKDTQIQLWKDTSILPYHAKWEQYMFNITRDGYKVILSSPWYINMVTYGYKEWYANYVVEPLANFTGTPEQAKLFIGGEAAMWSEYVDGTNIEPRVWPRASAIAERLWSPAHVNDTEDAKFRLDEHRCRLLRRGIAAAPVLNGYCGDYEYGMKNSLFEYFNKKYYPNR